MERNFYLVMQAAREISRENNVSVIDILFRDSEMKDHLINKLNDCMRYGIDTLEAICVFYEKCDVYHQREIDTYFNSRIEEIKKKTITYLLPGEEINIPGELILDLDYNAPTEALIEVCHANKCDITFLQDKTIKVTTDNKFFLFNLGRAMQPYIKQPTNLGDK